jgi:hypothetical protein
MHYDYVNNHNKKLTVMQAKEDEGINNAKNKMLSDEADLSPRALARELKEK